MLFIVEKNLLYKLKCLANIVWAIGGLWLNFFELKMT